METDDFRRNDGYSFLVEVRASNSSRSAALTFVLVCQVYGGSPSAAVAAIFSEHEWLPWFFRKVPVHFYENSANLRRFLDWLKLECGLSSDADIRSHHFARLGVMRVLLRYQYSPQALIQAAGGELEVVNKPKRHWGDMANQRAFLIELQHALGFSDDERERWYEVTSKVVAKHGGLTLLMKYYGNSMFHFLCAMYVVPCSFRCLR